MTEGVPKLFIRRWIMKMWLTHGCVKGWQRRWSQADWKEERRPESPTVLHIQPIIQSYDGDVHAKDNQSLAAAIGAAHSQGE